MFGLVPFEGQRGLGRRGQSFENFFDAFNNAFLGDSFKDIQKIQEFKVDVIDEGSRFELTAELPGVNKEDVSLSYNQGYLTIEASRNTNIEEKDEKTNYLRQERSTGSVSRSFYINNVDAEKISAEFKDGVLQVALPKIAKQEATGNIDIK